MAEKKGEEEISRKRKVIKRETNNKCEQQIWIAEKCDLLSYTTSEKAIGSLHDPWPDRAKSLLKRLPDPTLQRKELDKRIVNNLILSNIQMIIL